MKRETLQKTLMQRDNLSAEDAEVLISEAQDQLDMYLAEGDLDSAHDVCSEFFGLEPDYLEDLIF